MSADRARYRGEPDAPDYMTSEDIKRHVTEHMSERVFRQRILDEAKRCGWRYYFTQRSDRSPAGFPDLVLVRGHQMILAELKTMKGRLTDAQKDWLLDLSGVKVVDATVWRPDEWEHIRDEVLP